MPFHHPQALVLKSGGPFHRALRYAFHDWTLGCRGRNDSSTWAGVLMQGCAIYLDISTDVAERTVCECSTLLPLRECLMNGMLTSEYVWKTQPRIQPNCGTAGP